jgi:hypothetical protein
MSETLKDKICTFVQRNPSFKAKDVARLFRVKRQQVSALKAWRTMHMKGR